MNLVCLCPPVRKERIGSPPPEAGQDESSSSKSPTKNLEEEEEEGEQEEEEPEEEGCDRDSDEECSIRSSEDFQNLK